jgi:hypothetical protein
MNSLNTIDMKVEIQKRKEEILLELNKMVPQIDWEFQRVVEDIRHFKDGRTLKSYDIFFNGIHKISKDECFIKFEGGRVDVLEVGYNHIPNQSLGYKCENTNYKHINDWDGVNEFFNEYCIGVEGRLEKIKTGDMITPNMYRIMNVGIYETSNEEYSEGFLNLIFGISSKDDMNVNHFLKGYLKRMFNDFESTYLKIGSNSNGYFGTPLEMLKSFIENKVLHEMDYWLEQEWNKMLIDEKLSGSSQSEKLKYNSSNSF